MEESELRSLLEYYFHIGYETATLKRRLRDYSLRRRGMDIEEEKPREIIQQEISGPGELRGYRSVWHSMRLNHHIHIPRRRVAAILRELNPEGTRQRRSRRRRYTSYGPNFWWHVDFFSLQEPEVEPFLAYLDLGSNLERLSSSFRRLNSSNPTLAVDLVREPGVVLKKRPQFEQYFALSRASTTTTKHGAILTVAYQWDEMARKW